MNGGGCDCSGLLAALSLSASARRWSTWPCQGVHKVAQTLRSCTVTPDICRIRDLAKPGWCTGVSGCTSTRKLRHRALKCLVITSLCIAKYSSKITHKPKWQGMVNHPAEVLSFYIDFSGYVEMVAGKPKLTSSDTCRAWQGQQEELLLLYQ